MVVGYPYFWKYQYNRVVYILSPNSWWFVEQVFLNQHPAGQKTRLLTWHFFLRPQLLTSKTLRLEAGQFPTFEKTRCESHDGSMGRLYIFRDSWMYPYQRTLWEIPI